MNLMKQSFRKLFPYGLAAGVGILMIFLLVTREERNKAEDAAFRTDYVAVSNDFILNNVYIAHRIGKVTQITHVGKGGNSGKESYNVFRLVGDNASVILYLTLAKDESGAWLPQEAILNDNGILLQVPVPSSTVNHRSLNEKSP